VRSYLVLNLVGASVLAVDAYVEQQWGFLLLEGVWAVIAAWGLARPAPSVAKPSTCAGALALSMRLLFDRPLSCGESFEALVRDRLAALDRETVCPGGKPRFGTVDGSEFPA
jgi:hypothetical protein